MVQASIDASGTRTRALLTSAATTESTADVLGALFDVVSTMRRRHAETFGPSAILTRLAAGGAQRSCDLAEQLGLDQSTVSRHVAHLEAEGLAERRPMAADRRAHLVELTVRGETTAHALIAEKVAFLEGILATWDERDVTTFATLLGRFAHGLLAERTTTA